MACIVQKENPLLSRELASIKLTSSELSVTSATPTDTHCNGSTRMSNKTTAPSFSKKEDVHEAILFLQEKHESVLTGLHQQIEELQTKCDDLQFESHLRHVTSKEEENLKLALKDLTQTLAQRDQTIEDYDQQIKTQEKIHEEEIQKCRWRELQLNQQVEVSEQRTIELKYEISRLKSQVHDLQIYCSGIRTGNVGQGNRTRTNLPRNISSQKLSNSQGQQHKTSQESLDSFGPKSLGSEDGDIASFRESRLGGSFKSRLSAKSGSRIYSSPCQSINLNASQSFALPPMTPRDPESRPMSSVVTLPPISQSQGISRTQVRRQLRLASAPPLDANANVKPDVPQE